MALIQIDSFIYRHTLFVFKASIIYTVEIMDSSVEMSSTCHFPCQFQRQEKHKQKGVGLHSPIRLSVGI